MGEVVAYIETEPGTQFHKELTAKVLGKVNLGQHLNEVYKERSKMQAVLWRFYILTNLAMR